MSSQVSNIFKLISPTHKNQSNAVDWFYKNLAHRVETHLNKTDFNIVLGANPLRWKVWNNSLTPLHLIYRKRFLIFNVSFMQITTFAITIWKLAVHFLYHMAFKRHQKILFIGNPKIKSLSVFANEQLHKQYQLYNVRTIDKWIPGLIGNITNMFLPMKASQKGDIRDVRGIRLANLSEFRGQAYTMPSNQTTYNFLYNYFYPEALILLNTGYRAYNADKEIVKKGLPTLALTSTDTKMSGFSGCFYTLPAGVNYEDHLHFYIFFFYTIIAYARSKFLYKEYLSLKTNPFPLRKKQVLHSGRSINFENWKINNTSTQIMRKYQQTMRAINTRILNLEKMDLLRKRSSPKEDDLNQLTLSKMAGWFTYKNLQQQSIDEKEIHQNFILEELPGYKTENLADQLHEILQQNLLNDLIKNINTIADQYKFIVSIFLLQQLAFGCGRTFVRNEITGFNTNDKVFFFLNSPNSRILQRLTKIMYNINLQKNFVGKKNSLTKNIQFFDRELLFVKSIDQHNRAIIKSVKNLDLYTKPNKKVFKEDIVMNTLNPITGIKSSATIRTFKKLQNNLKSYYGFIKLTRPN